MISVTVEGDVATLTIDNPGKRNAMSTDMWRSLPVILQDLSSRVRLAVLTGAGDVFCAGADIASLTATTTQDSAAAEAALAAFPLPTIAKINGDCVGGGAQLALACDLRVAVPTARFGVTPARLGVVYPPLSTARLAATVGQAWARRLLLTAELIDAARAERIGLVHELTETLDERVAQLAQTLASRSLLTQAATKQILAGQEEFDRWIALAHDSGEAAEGMAAFLQRRTPDFPWRP